MFIMAVKLIITDIDGCVSPEESVAWDLASFARFAQLCRDAGDGKADVAPITLCTGRPQPYAEALMKVLDIRHPAICENGAVVYSLHDNRPRYGAGITPEKIHGIRAVRAFLDDEVLPDFPEAVVQFGKEANLSVYSSRPEVFGDIQARVEKFIAEKGSPELIISPTHFYLNLSLTGIDKGTTLRAMMADLGITKEEAAGIGDTEGDLAIRESVAFFACPANAKQAVKELSDYVSPYPDILGLLDILERPEMRRA
jgi:hydroxymethylpyrimidine pyrophosphatase-like HAD family hydrolase